MSKVEDVKIALDRSFACPPTQKYNKKHTVLLHIMSVSHISQERKKDDSRDRLRATQIK